MIKMKELFSKTSGTLTNLFKKYPLTLIITVILTLFLTVFVGGDLFSSKTIGKITLFGVLWAVSIIFIETFNFKNNKTTILFYVLTAIIDFLLVRLQYNTNGAFKENVQMIITGYFLCSLALTMYIITRKQNVKFQEYILKIFNNIFHSSIIYGVLNIGMTLIIVIFVELILDGSYGEFILRSQILLLGLFYFPAMLNAMTDVKECNASNFIKGLVKYVLIPLVSIAVVIIYIYIAKILIQKEMPRNVIFRILAGIFIVAFPVWNMANNFRDNKIIYKISTYLPFAYFPFIFLEIYSLGIRIIDFGITPTRYIGIAFILFQIIVLAFTIFRKKIKLEYTFVVLALIIFMLFMTPLNYNTVSKLSQKYILENNLKEGMNFESLTKESQGKVYGAYRYLTNNYGEDYISDYVKSMENDINGYAPINANYSRNEYINFYDYGQEINVQEYSSILPVRMADSKYNYGMIKIYDYDNKFIANVNIANIISKLIELNEENYEQAKNYMLQNRYVYINATQTLFINDLNITYKTTSKEVVSVSLSGYLLNKIEQQEKNQEENQEDPYNYAINKLDKNVFLTDFDNYKAESNEVNITEKEAKEIAKKGFEESKRIASEGTDNIESETVKIEEVYANNYFTRYYYGRSETYTNIKRDCYAIQRENEMGCGVTVYVDANTGLIIGGRAFGD